MGLYQKSNVATVDEFLRERYKLDQQLKENLSQARARMKLYADKNRTERVFEQGDEDFHKSHPYTQQSVELRNTSKCQILWPLSDY